MLLRPWPGIQIKLLLRIVNSGDPSAGFLTPELLLMRWQVSENTPSSILLSLAWRRRWYSSIICVAHPNVQAEMDVRPQCDHGDLVRLDVYI